jgi:hypothetical protein
MNSRDVAAIVFSQTVFAFALGGVIYFARREYWSKSRIHTVLCFGLGAAISAILQLLSRLAL